VGFLLQVTVDADPCEPTLSKLFPSQLVSSQVPPQAIGVRFLCGPTVTVVASKGTKRYRLQSNSLSALGTTLSWLLSALEKYFQSQHQIFSAKCSPPLPLNEYFDILDRHFKVSYDTVICAGGFYSMKLCS
jgi:Bardet-Biedl syndrome 9 protein